jgi:hypothetical protein
VKPLDFPKETLEAARLGCAYPSFSVAIPGSRCTSVLLASRAMAWCSAHLPVH